MSNRVEPTYTTTITVVKNGQVIEEEKEGVKENGK